MMALRPHLRAATRPGLAWPGLDAAAGQHHHITVLLVPQ
jgi:hypothetical protein